MRDLQVNKAEYNIFANQYSEEKKYWLNKLTGIVKTSFIDSFNLSQKPTFRKAVKDYKLDKELTEKLLNASSNSDHLLFVLLTSGIIQLLNRYTDSDDIIIGIPLEKQKVDSKLINYALPIRCAIDKNIPYRTFLSNVRNEIKEASIHQNFPIETLPNDLELIEDENLFSLFDVAVLLNGLHEVEYMSNYKVNIMFIFKKEGDSITCTVEYNEVFPINLIDQIIKHFSNLLLNSLNFPEKELFRIELLDSEEYNNLVYADNGNIVSYSSEMNIYELISAKSKDVLSNIAIEQEESSITYADLIKKSAEISEEFLLENLKKGSIVALMGHRSVEMISNILAILKCGSAFLPINAQDPWERIKYVLNDSGSEFLVLEKRVWEKFSIYIDEIVEYRKNLQNGFVLCKMMRNKHESQDLPDNIAYIIYTSGSTGFPKGVIITHKNLINYVHWAAQKYMSEQHSAIPFYTSFSFDMSITSIFVPLYTGNRIIIYGGDEKDFLLDKVYEENKANVVKATPSHLRMLLASSPNRKNSKIQKIIVGGEQFDQKLAEDVYFFFDKKVEIYNEYGPTEATVGCMIYEYNPEQRKSLNVAIGHPINNTQIYLLNSNLQLTPKNVVGEIYISGDSVSSGYINKTDLTTKYFIENPFIENRIMYKTGDLAIKMTDGNIHFLRRIDAQIKMRGFRIELGEIEAKLRRNEKIKDAVVLTKADRSGEEIIVAYYIKLNEIDADELKKFLLESIPEYMVPSIFMEISNIPIRKSGKIDINSLPDPKHDVKEIIKASNSIEEKLTNIWSDILGLEPDEFGVTTNFFDLGGHSLKVTILVFQIQKVFNVTLNLSDIFKSTTVREQANLISQKSLGDFKSIEPAIKKDHYKLSYAQNRLFVLHQMDPQGVAYNIPMVLEINGISELDKIEKAFQSLIERHEIFRTYFDIVNEQTIQKIQPNIDFCLEKFELYKKETGQIKDIVTKFIRPFNLKSAPLLRAGVIDIHNNNQCILLVDMHHIVSDAVSMELIKNDFIDFYLDKKLHPLTLQYKDFSEWQNRTLVRKVLEEQEKYWLEIFSDGVPELNLKTDYARSKELNFEGNSLEFTLNPDITKKLRNIANENKVTLYTLMISVFKVLLNKLTDQEDIVVGTSVAGRTHADLEHIVGVFVNSLPIRTKIDSNLSFRNYLLEVKELTIKAFENQNYPFEALVEKIVKVRKTDRNPIFDIMFGYLEKESKGNKFEGINIVPYRYENKVSKFDLTLEIEAENSLNGVFIYKTNLYKRSTIEKFIKYYRFIIEQIILNQDTLISEINLLSSQENDLIIQNFVKPKATKFKINNIIELFDAIVKNSPDSIAIIENQKEISYAQLQEKSNNLANYLMKKGLAQNNIVGLILDRSIETIISIIAVLRAGGAFLPIDRNIPKDRLKYILQSSKTNILITKEKLLPFVKKLVSDDTINVICVDKEMHNSVSNTFNTLALDNLAYCIYTSGTTGMPKGVLISHNSLQNYIQWADEYYLSGDKLNFPLFTSLSFDLTITSIFTPLITGNKLYIYGDQNVAKTIEDIISNIDIGILKMTPSHLRILNQFKTVPKNIKKIIVGGEALKTSLTQHIFDKSESKVEIFNEYGPSEATVGATVFKYDGKYEESNEVYIGKPIANTEVFILDKNKKILPENITGEIYIGGAGVSQGYLENDDLTQKYFIPNPYETEGKILYKTGDYGKWVEDGNIEFLGRKDNQVKIQGYRIELGEIENCLKKNQMVEEVVVRVESNDILMAYIVTKEETDANELKNFIAAYLPNYMIPSQFRLIDHIPLTPNGKLDENKLEQFSKDIKGKSELLIPITGTQRIVAKAWTEVLKIENINTNQNFFDIGGNSMSLINVKNILEKSFKKEVSLVEMFEYPTIASIADYLDNEKLYQGKKLNEIIDDTINNEEDYNRMKNTVLNLLDTD